MRVFVTGASGWIGSATVDELLANGHQVLGLARSDASAESLAARGAEVLRGDLDDLESLRAGAASTDGTIHLANKHDFVTPGVSDRAERGAVETLTATLEGSGRPLLLASGVAGLTPGRAVTEADPNPTSGPEAPRGGTENLALEFVDRGIRAVPIRFAPSVHGPRDHGFIAAVTEAARRTGVSGYVDDGSAAWAAVARTDAVRLVRLALEHAEAGTIVHAVTEEAVSTKAIAEAIGAQLGLPTASIPAAEAMQHFGFIGRFFALDLRAESAVTRERFGWEPTGTTLLEDIAGGAYTAD